MGWRRALAPLRWIFRHPWVVTTTITFLCLGFVVHGQDEFCGLAEGVHARNVQQLSDTYDYLGKLRPAETDLTINRFVIANLPRQEGQARFDEAPAMCDHLGLGKPEPDPVIPSRPARVNILVEKFQHSRVRTK